MIPSDPSNVPLGEVVELRTLLFGALSYVENSLNSLVNSPKTYSSKLKLTEKLYKSQIVLARYLTLLRWYRKNKSIYRFLLSNKTNSDGSINTQKFLKSTQQQIQQLHKNERIQTYKPDLSIYNFNPQPSKEQIRLFYVMLLMRKPASRRLRNFTQVSINEFAFPNEEYMLQIKIDSSQFLQITRVDVLWPKEIPSKKDFIRNSISPYIRLDLKLFEQLKDLDISLHHIYLIGQYSHFAKLLLKYQDEFNFVLKRHEDCILIQFLGYYGSRCTFGVYIRNENVQIISKIPVLEIPSNLKTAENNFSSSNDTPMKFNRKILSINIGKNPDVQSILTKLRDTMIFTHIHNIYFLICRSLAFSPFSLFKISLIFPNTNVTCGRISIIYAGFPVTSVTFSSKTGCPSTISEFLPAGNVAHLAKALRLGPRDVADSISALAMNLWSFRVIRIAQNPKASLPPVPIQNLSRAAALSICVSYSFAQNFKLIATRLPQKFLVKVIDKNGFRIQNYRSIVFENKGVKEFQKVNEHINSSMFSILLLSLEEKMKGTALNIVRNENSIAATFHPHMYVKFKIHKTGSWKLHVDRRTFPFLSFGGIVFIGQQITMRFDEYIMYLITSVQFIGLYLNRVTGTCVELKPDDITYINDLNFSIRAAQMTLHMSFAENNDNYKVGNYALVFKDITGIAPIPNFSFTPQFPLNFPLLPLKYSVAESFGAIISGRLSSLVQFRRIFSRRGWLITSIDPNLCFSLIFTKPPSTALTLNIQLKSVRDFAVVVPTIGQSTKLKLPLSRFPRLFKSIPLSHAAFRIKMEQCLEMRTYIETYIKEDDYMRMRGFVGTEESDFTINYRNSKNDVTVHHTAEGFEINSPRYPGLNELSMSLVELISDRQIRTAIATLLIECASSMDQDIASFVFTLVSSLTHISDKMNWIGLFKSISTKKGVFQCNVICGQPEFTILANNANGITHFLAMSGINTLFQCQDSEIFMNWFNNYVR